MVRTRGPALSLDAAGSIADAVTFTHWKGRSYLKRRSTPSDPRSSGQVANRVIMRWLNEQWSTLTSVQRGTWNDLAATTGIAPFSAFLAQNLKRWSRFAPPTKNWPATEENVPGTIHGSYPRLDGYIRGTSWNADLLQLNDNWIYALFMGDSLLFEAAPGNLIDFRVLDTSDRTYFDLTPLEPGRFYFRGAMATDDGVWGRISSVKTEVIDDY